MFPVAGTLQTDGGAVGGAAGQGRGGADLAGRGTQRGDARLLVRPRLRGPRVQPVWAESSPQQGRARVCGLGPRERLFARSDAGQAGAAR